MVLPSGLKQQRASRCGLSRKERPLAYVVGLSSVVCEARRHRTLTLEDKMSITKLEDEFRLIRGELSRLREASAYAQYTRRVRSDRVLHIPPPDLMTVQRIIAQRIGSMVDPHPAAHGYVADRSIISNARCHTRKQFVFGADLTNFFDSITQDMVARALHDIMGWSRADTEFVAELCCYRGTLPQGAPTSPLLSNLICYPLDERLQNIAIRLSCDYSRYSDDLYFSTRERCFPRELGIASGWGRARVARAGSALEEAVQSMGFRINACKTRLQPRDHRQIVTGLVVNNGVSVKSGYLRMLRAALSNWNTYGLDAVLLDFADREPRKIPEALRGMIEYVGQVHGKTAPAYTRLINQFNILAVRDGLIARSAGGF
jgi:RNA-directed DNA polymerase